jgi:hypothetical protein
MNFSSSGTISKIYLQEIPNKAKGGKSRFEARIEIQVDDGSGEPHFEEFAGESSLAKEYAVGQKVEIEATTSSGRHIKSIKVLE